MNDNAFSLALVLSEAVKKWLSLAALLFTSCGEPQGITQEEYDSIIAERDMAQGHIQTLQDNMNTVLAYAEFLDIIMFPAWLEIGITPRFNFDDEVDWFVELKNRAKDLEDLIIENSIEQLEAGNEAAMGDIMNRCLAVIELFYVRDH